MYQMWLSMEAAFSASSQEVSVLLYKGMVQMIEKKNQDTCHLQYLSE
jgi:hypothetical protein